MKRKVTKLFSTLPILLIVFLGLLAGFWIGFRYVKSQNQRFARYDTRDLNGDLLNEANKKIIINQDTPGAIRVYIRLGDRTSDIARRLQKAGVINHPFLFNLMSKVNGFDGGYQYGTHFIKKDMTYDEIMFNLTLKPSATNITFVEGNTYREMKQVLRNKGIQFNESEMDDIVQNPTKYFSTSEYPFLEHIQKNPARQWILQGYLFPDTYAFDLNSDSISIVQMMLNNTVRRIDPELLERAKKLNLSLDQILTLASIIENEAGNIQEMYKISRVFHNRLAQGMPLQSCATINFLRMEQNLPRLVVVSEKDLNMDSPYNTYKNAGLPPGPICNPGLEAIRAALYPSIDPEDRNLLYFAATGKGDNVFSSDFEEHVRNVQKYVLPQAQKEGFSGEIKSGSGVVYSTGGDIVVKEGKDE